MGIESHVEDPENSELFKQYPSFHGNPLALAFLADTMKVLLTGAVDDHHPHQSNSLEGTSSRKTVPPSPSWKT